MDQYLLTVDQAAQYLCVSRLTIYDWVSQRRIEHVKVGRAVRFKRDTLNKWIDRNTVKVRTTVNTERTDHGHH